MKLFGILSLRGKCGGNKKFSEAKDPFLLFLALVAILFSGV